MKLVDDERVAAQIKELYPAIAERHKLIEVTVESALTVGSCSIEVPERIPLFYFLAQRLLELEGNSLYSQLQGDAEELQANAQLNTELMAYLVERIK